MMHFAEYKSIRLRLDTAALNAKTTNFITEFLRTLEVLK
jgi:hypothetical protein